MRTQVLCPACRLYQIVAMVLLILAGGADFGRADSTPQDDANKKNPVIRSYGSRLGYRTEVMSQTNGTLNPDDRRHVAVLTTQILRHIDQAQRYLDIDHGTKAKDEVELGLKAIRVVKEILPVTTVHTKITSPDGATVYDDTRAIPVQQVPLFEEMLIARNLTTNVEATTDVETTTELKGQGRNRSDLETHAFTDVDYIERQLQRAANALAEKKIDLASQSLSFARGRGFAFRPHGQDSPITTARDAVWFAKRAIDENNAEQARANLLVARQQLEICRQLSPEDDRSEVRLLLDEVKQLNSRLQQQSVAAPKSSTSKSDETARDNVMNQWWTQVNEWLKKRS